MRKYRIVILVVSLLYVAHIKAQTYSVKTVPDVKKQGQAYVCNPDNILSTDTQNKLNALLLSLEQQTSVEVDVVVINAVDSEDIDGFANELFNYWGTGKKDKDNGLLILFVLEERFLRFETGYGLEGVLPDAICKRIQTELMFPEFRKGNYDQGMLNGVGQIINYLSKPEAIEEVYSNSGYASKSSEDSSLNIFLTVYILFTLIISIFFFAKIRYSLRLKGKSNYERYKKLHPYTRFLGCFLFLFPLTLVPIWIWLRRKLKQLRNTPIPCPQCNNLMRRLNPKEELLFLTPVQKLEQKINSVDYDVWKCNTCNYINALAYKNLFSSYTDCPHCQARTFGLKSDRVIVRASKFSTGKGLKTYLCLNCKHSKEEYYVIPRIVESSRRSGGGSSRGGSFGGGRGGGSSGGGGASGRW